VTKLDIYIVVALVLGLGASAIGIYEHHTGYLEGKQEVQVQYDKFKNDVTTAGIEAEKKRLVKEKNDENKIIAATTARDSALVRLQSIASAARASPSIMSSVPASASPAGKICFDRAGLDAAIQHYRIGIQGLVVEGDKAIIDNRSWLAAWPK